MRIRRLMAGTAAVMTALAGALGAGAVWAQEKLGQPTDKSLGLQPGAAPLKHDAIWFHDVILLPIITVIVLFVLALLIWIVLRYNKRANPKPASFSHNTAIEILWTVIPVLILVFIAFFSFSLLRKYNDMPTPDVVVKATGYQWYWAYDYPELGVEGVESRLLPEARELKTSDPKTKPFLLAVDNELIVPVNKVVQVQVTGYDVIHSFALPAFGLKTDAIPGRLNSTWFRAEKPGIYYGQCSELCGVDHAYMPIAIRVVSEKEFDAYIIKAGGKTKAMIAAEEAAAAAAAQQVAANAAASADASAAASAVAPAEADAAASAAAPAVQ